MTAGMTPWVILTSAADRNLASTNSVWTDSGSTLRCGDRSLRVLEYPISPMFDQTGKEGVSVTSRDGWNDWFLLSVIDQESMV
jgi:hypothetical protein